MPHVARLALLLAGCLASCLASCLTGGLAAQEPPTAASVTEPGRSLARPLDVVLGGAGSAAVERTLLVVIDPSPPLAAAGFADAFAAAVQRHAAALAKTRLGLGVIGSKGCVAVPPSAEHGKVVDELRARMQHASGEFQNVYGDLRAAAAALAGAPGERVLLLVSLGNGDVEDDVEQTAQALAKAKITTHVLTSEVTLADSYWARMPQHDRPRGTTLTGADGAVIDLPWGWLFQVTPANETTAAGYPVWGLARLAAATGGRVFQFAAAKDTAHQCAVFATCLFCSGDHLPPDANWSEPLIAQLAPLACSRADTFTALGKDPFFRAMVDAWRAAAEAGLVHGAPAVRLSGTVATPDRPHPARDLDLTDSASFDRQARRADEAAARAQALGDQLQAQLERLDKESGSPREKAAAHYTRVLLQLTRVNLLLFAAFCRETAPALFAKDAPVPQPPEIPAVDGDQRPVGIGFGNLGLCHGVKPFFEVELPGGKALRPELERLDALFTAYEERYGRSQFGAALRHNGIARFWVTFPGNATRPPRVRPKSGSDPGGPVTPARPQRNGQNGGGPATGPTTGGG